MYLSVHVNQNVILALSLKPLANKKRYNGNERLQQLPLLLPLQVRRGASKKVAKAIKQKIADAEDLN